MIPAAFLMVSVGVLVFGTAVASAQESQDKSKSGFLAGGIMMKPDYAGSDDYEIAPLVYGRVQKDNYYIETEGPGIKANIVPFEGLEAGPLLGYNFGRDDVDDGRVDRMRDIDGTLEAGAFVKIPVKGVLKPSDELSFGAKVKTDVAGEHDGTRFSFGPSYSYSPAQNWRLTTSLSATYADENYTQTFFGVDDNNSARSGFARYNADGGFHEVGGMIVANYGINQNWGITGLLGYDHLIGDAADSPLVDDAGSQGQFLTGLGVSYRF